MPCPCFLRRRWLIPLGFLLLPPVCWALLLVVVPTGCARRKIVAAVEKATGRPVKLGSIRLGALGGVTVGDLEIGAPQSADDPWLKAASAQINTSLLHVLTGNIAPSEVVVDGLTLRVLRRPDGTLELNDFLQPAAPAAPAGSTASSCPNLDIELRNARVMLIDQAAHTTIELTGIEGTATWSGPLVAVHELHGTLNGGPFDFAGQLDRGAPSPAFQGHLRAHEVELSEGMDAALSYLVPALAGTRGDIKGRLDLEIYLKGQGTTSDQLRRTLAGKGLVKLDPVRLDGSTLLTDIGRLVPLPPHGEVGAVRTTFAIKDGRIGTEDLTLQVLKTPIVLSGWTDFDGKVDYRVKTEALAERLPGKARDLLSELSIDLKDSMTLKVQGTLDNMVVTLDGAPLNAPRGGSPAAGPPRLDDSQRLRDLGRRLKDRILR